MCPPPFDPIRVSLVGHGFAGWFLGGTCLELGLLALVLVRERRRRQHDHALAERTWPWLELVAIAVPVVCLGRLAAIPDVGAPFPRLLVRLGTEAVTAADLALFFTPCLAIALVTLALASAQRWRVSSRRLLLASLVVVAGLVPFVLAVLTYTDAAFSLADSREMRAPGCGVYQSLHWDNVMRSHFWLLPSAAVAGGALCLGAVLAVWAVEEPVAMESGPARGAVVPRLHCWLTMAVAAPVTLALVGGAVPLWREVLRPVPWEYEWTSGETPPYAQVPRGVGPDAVPEAPAVECARNQCRLDGVNVSVAEFTEALRLKRELWRQVHPDRTFPGALLILGDESQPATEVVALIRAANAAGYPHAHLYFSECVLERRPQLGALTGCKGSTVRVELGPPMAREQRTPVMPIHGERYGDFARRAAHLRRGNSTLTLSAE